ncbi:tyrosine-type recombinase/integrase [Planctomicrobium sp. SH527]|uniref:tyrosine-type recombinase/integrase n=1 Tax=Planctomicrobium sp. SH527 TaxID=3448123 RepID=UPI003F5BCD33
MPKSLSDAAVRNAKPKTKPYKLADGEGLFLLVMVNGSKYWRLKYFFGGKERTLALGVYPDISLADARDRRAQAKKLLAIGTDPGAAKKHAKHLAVAKAANSFEAIAREWYGQREHEWSPKTAGMVLDRLERHILPKLSNRPISEINAPEVLEVLRVVEASGALEMTRRVSHIIGQVFMYAIATGRAERNPVNDLRGALKTPVVKHRAYLREADLPDYLNKLRSYAGTPLTKLALQFLLLTFVRTTELRAARWEEMNWEKSEWRIPADRMKMREEHIVPLSTQSIAVLRELEKHSGTRPFIFPNETNPATFMSENTMLYALYRMGYRHKATGHGFRSTASTILNEHGFRADVIERQLAHSERNSVRAAYNHAQYLPERREMMQWWADFLDRMAAKKSSK